jgi:hypothetical protein
LLPHASGLTFSSKVIFRDEGLPCDFVYVLYNLLRIKLNESCIHNIVTDAVETEHKFIAGEEPLGLISLSDASHRLPTAHASQGYALQKN